MHQLGIAAFHIRIIPAPQSLSDRDAACRLRIGRAIVAIDHTAVGIKGDQVAGDPFGIEINVFGNGELVPTVHAEGKILALFVVVPAFDRPIRLRVRFLRVKTAVLLGAIAITGSDVHGDLRHFRIIMEVAAVRMQGDMDAFTPNGIESQVFLRNIVSEIEDPAAAVLSGAVSEKHIVGAFICAGPFAADRETDGIEISFCRNSSRTIQKTSVCVISNAATGAITGMQRHISVRNDRFCPAAVQLRAIYIRIPAGESHVFII